jgi:hypothetical protein
MKKTILKFATATALLTYGLVNATASDIAKLDVKKECNVEANGIEKVIATAAKYNEIAVKNKIEFMRFGMQTSEYIEAVNTAGKKKTGDATIEFGAWRACSFAISALTQDEEGKKTWRASVPGDGYKY